VVVERRQRLPEGYHGIHVRQLREQRRERRIGLEHDARTALVHQPRVAREVDAVAQPLLGMQQHRLARRILASRPSRLGEPALGDAHVAAMPARFVVRPAALQVAGREPGQRAVVACAVIVRLRCERARIALDRLGMAVHRRERHAAVVERLGRARRRGQRAIIVGEGLVEAVQHAQRRAAVGEHLGMAGLDFERAGRAADAFVPFAAARGDGGGQVQRIEMACIAAQNVLAHRLRVLQLARAEERRGARHGFRGAALHCHLRPLGEREPQAEGHGGFHRQRHRRVQQLQSRVHRYCAASQSSARAQSVFTPSLRQSSST
jgi:hypothetical protein